MGCYTTCTLGLVRPIPTVILSITLPPCGNTASVSTLILEISRAAWNISGGSTVGFIRVISTVIHAVTLPLQAHTHTVGTLEGVDVTHFAKFRRCGTASIFHVLIRPVFTVFDPVTHQRLKQTLGSVLTYKLHVASAQGITVVLIGAIWTLLFAVTVGGGWQASVIGAEEAFTPSSLTILRIFIRVILTVIIAVTHPALWYTVTCVTLEATRFTCMVAHCAVGLI